MTQCPLLLVVYFSPGTQHVQYTEDGSLKRDLEGNEAAAFSEKTKGKACVFCCYSDLFKNVLSVTL